MRKVVAIIQARVGSTRLPQKVLKDIVGKPMLWHVIERVKQAKMVNEIVVATTTNEEDIPIMRLAEDCSVQSYAGSEMDVLDRHFQAATRYRADPIVRITSDCPLIDPEVVDQVIKRFLSGDFDYVSNTVELTYPDGLDVEVFSYRVLKRAHEEARTLSEREHVTPHMRNHPGMFKVCGVEFERDLSSMRWTVDEERDLEFVRAIYKRLYKEGQIFYMEDILNLLKKHPELIEINKGIPRGGGYLKSLREDRILAPREKLP